MKAKKQVDRRAIIISAVLTVLLLAGAGSVALASNWRTGSDTTAQAASQSAVENAPFVVTVEPLFSDTTSQTRSAAPEVVGVGQFANDQIAAAYEAQLEQAYQALQEAYAQIDTLQSAQAQMAAQADYDEEHEHEDDRFVIGAHHHEDHDDD